MAEIQTEVKNGSAGDSPVGKINLEAVKRGRGRPPGSGKKSASQSEEPKATRARSSDVDPADASFLAEALVYIVETGDELLKRAALAKLQSVLPDKVEEFETIQKEMGLTNPDKALLKRTVERLAQKYSLVGKFAPEILLFGILAKWGVGHARVFANMEKMVVSLKSEKKAEPAKA